MYDDKEKEATYRRFAAWRQWRDVFDTCEADVRTACTDTYRTYADALDAQNDEFYERYKAESS